MTFLPQRKKLRNAREREPVEIRCKRRRSLTIFASNETAIIGKIVELKACILNSINSLDVI